LAQYEYYYSKMLQYYCTLCTLQSLGEGTATRSGTRNIGSALGATRTTGIGRLAAATVAASAEDANAAVAAAASAATRTHTLKAGLLKSIGAGKVSRLKDQGIKTVEDLAAVPLNTASATLYTNNPSNPTNAMKTLKHMVAAAKAFLQDKLDRSEARLARTAASRGGGSSSSSSSSAAAATSSATSAAATATSPVGSDGSATHTPPLPFPSYTEFGGYLLTRYTCDSIGFTVAAHEEPCQKAHMAGIGGEILSFDQTFWTAGKVIARIPGSTEYFKPFQGMVSGMNEYSQVCWYAMVYRKECMSELEPQLLALKARLDNQATVKSNDAEETKSDKSGDSDSDSDDETTTKPACIYVDNCCEVRAAYQKIFPGTPILLDLFHFQKRFDACIAVPTNDPLAWAFRSDLKRACLVCDKDDWKAVADRLAGAKKPISDAAIRPSCRKYVPQPAPLRKAISAVFKRYIDRDSRVAANHAYYQSRLDSELSPTARKELAKTKAGLPKVLFNNRLKTCWVNALSHVCQRATKAVYIGGGAGSNKGKTLIVDTTHQCDATCVGCLSDPVGVNLNFKYVGHEDKVNNKHVKPIPSKGGMFTGRSSSQQENMHKHWRAFVRVATSAAKWAGKAWRFMTDWNIKRGVEKRGDADYGSTNLNLLALLNAKAMQSGAVKSAPFPHAVLRQSNMQAGIEVTSPFIDAAIDPAVAIAAAKKAMGQKDGAVGSGSSSSSSSSSSRSSGGSSRSGSSSSSSSSGGTSYGGAAAAAAVVVGTLSAAQSLFNAILLSMNFRRQKAMGCGRCMIRCCMADQPGLATTRAKIIGDGSPETLKYLWELKKGALANLRAKIDGTGRYHVDGKMDAAMLLTLAYMADERHHKYAPHVCAICQARVNHAINKKHCGVWTVGGDILVQDTIEDWFGYHNTDDSMHPNTLIWGDHLFGYCLAEDKGFNLYITSCNQDQDNLMQPIRFALHTPAGGVGRNVHMLKYQTGGVGKHFDLLICLKPQANLSLADYLAHAHNEGKEEENDGDGGGSGRKRKGDSGGKGDGNGKDGGVILPGSFPPTSATRLPSSFEQLAASSGYGKSYPAPFTTTGDVGRDERILFDEMKDNFDVAKSGQKSYAAFASQWNARVGEENAKRIMGDDEARSLRYKTRAHLKEFAETLNALNQEGRGQNSAADQQERKAMYRTLKAARMTGPAAQHPQSSLPSAGASGGFPFLLPQGVAMLPGMVPPMMRVPHPMQVDPSISGGVQNTYPPVAPPAEKLSGNHQCSSCGNLYAKTKHARKHKGPKCILLHCRCGKLKSEHTATQPAGPTCTASFSGV
jgi:uncharacterized membrane protein YgcG